MHNADVHIRQADWLYLLLLGKSFLTDFVHSYNAAYLPQEIPHVSLLPMLSFTVTNVPRSKADTSLEAEFSGGGLTYTCNILTVCQGR